MQKANNSDITMRTRINIKSNEISTILKIGRNHQQQSLSMTDTVEGNTADATLL